MALILTAAMICSAYLGGTTYQCGAGDPKKGDDCISEASCLACDQTQLTCPLHHIVKHGPYPRELLTGNKCYEMVDVADCWTECDCFSAGGFCDSTHPCMNTWTNCSTTQSGPHWILRGTCGQGSPCD